MRRPYRALGILLCVSLGLVRPAFAQGSYEKYLAAADVEKVTGARGVTLIARGSAAGAGGDLNFADGAGELMLMVQFADARNFATLKDKYAKAPVSGVGEQAFQGGSMPGMPDNLLAFTKGTRCVVLTAFGDFVNKKVYLTIDQLTALGKLIASRL
jgi:hypothetical protein